MTILGKIILVLAVISVLVAGCYLLSGGAPVVTSTGEVQPAIEKAKASATTFSFLCLCGMAISVFAMVNGSKSASAMLVASGAGLAVSLVIATYAKLIAFICLAGAVCWFVASLFMKKGFWSLPFPKVCRKSKEP